MALQFKFRKDNREFLNEEAEYRNPNKGKWYAQAVHLGTVGLDELSEIVQQNCSMKKSDVMAVLTELIDVMKLKLQDSYVVRLDGIGSFKLGIKTVGADSLDEFSVAKNITGTRVNFQPAYRKDSASGRRTVALTHGVRIKEAVKNAVV